MKTKRPCAFKYNFWLDNTFKKYILKMFYYKVSKNIILHRRSKVWYTPGATQHALQRVM